MFEIKNVVSVGDYEAKAISAKFNALIINTDGMKFITLDNRTVKAFAELPDPKLRKSHAIYIAFKDGKKSIVDVNEKVFKAFNLYCPRNDKMKMDESLIDKYRGIGQRIQPK